ncbi:hypothetical protein [Rariglobus hedericola]
MSDLKRSAKMKNVVIFIASVIALSGCYRSEFVGRSQAEILAQYNTEAATVVRYGGPSEGPYNDVGGFVGNPNQSINLSWKENEKDVRVDAPAEPGYYYQVNRFGTESGRFFWILIKLKNKNEPNQAPETTILTVTDRAPSSTLRASADRVSP